MIERFLMQKAAIQLLYLEEGLNTEKLEELSREDFKLIESFINVLKAGEIAPKSLSCSKCSSSSLIIPIVTSMIRQLTQLYFKNSPSESIAYRNKLVDSLKSRFGKIEECNLI